MLDIVYLSDPRKRTRFSHLMLITKVLKARGDDARALRVGIKFLFRRRPREVHNCVYTLFIDSLTFVSERIIISS
jgi:hypothetical protein